MGNRATVIFTDGKQSFSPAVYLHWNGGPESIYAFLEELDRRGVRADQDYECARFIQLVGEFFDQDAAGGTSLGVTNGPRSAACADLEEVATDHGDNGFYLVNRTTEPLSMRRFTEQYNHAPNGDFLAPTLKEWTPAQVEREAIAAKTHDYADGIRQDFAKIHPEVSKVG